MSTDTNTASPKKGTIGALVLRLATYDRFFFMVIIAVAAFVAWKGGHGQGRADGFEVGFEVGSLSAPSFQASEFSDEDFQRFFQRGAFIFFADTPPFFKDGEFFEGAKGFSPEGSESTQPEEGAPIRDFTQPKKG